MERNGEGGQQRKIAGMVWTNIGELLIYGDGRLTGNLSVVIVGELVWYVFFTVKGVLPFPLGKKSSYT